MKKIFFLIIFTLPLCYSLLYANEFLDNKISIADKFSNGNKIVIKAERIKLSNKLIGFECAGEYVFLSHSVDIKINGQNVQFLPQAFYSICDPVYMSLEIGSNNKYKIKIGVGDKDGSYLIILYFDNYDLLKRESYNDCSDPFEVITYPESCYDHTP